MVATSHDRSRPDHLISRVRLSRIVAAFWREATHIAKLNYDASAGRFAARSSLQSWPALSRVAIGIHLRLLSTSSSCRRSKPLGVGLAASGVTSYGYNLTRNRGEAAGPGWANLLPGPLSLKAIEKSRNRQIDGPEVAIIRAPSGDRGRPGRNARATAARHASG